MKTDRTSLAWGLVIVAAIVLGGVIVGFQFPHLRLPLSEREQMAFLTSATICGLLVASYKKLWKELGFWALLLAFVGANALFYLLVGGRIGGADRFFIYGAVGGAEFFVFALVVMKLYRRAPDTRSWSGRKTHTQ
jgi:uncharacterized protein involved in response to NO